jgi:hypothetical protein
MNMKGTFFIDHAFYDMQQGDLFLIPANTIHRATPDTENPVTSIAIYFNPSLVQLTSLGDSFSYLQCFEQAARHGSYHYPLLQPQRQRVDLSMESIHYEWKQPSIGQRQATLLHLLQLLLFLNRKVAPGTKTHAADSIIGPIWMRDILQHIDQHFCEDIGLQTLAKQVSVTPAHFSRVFKQLVGMNITAYIMTKRMICNQITKSREMICVVPFPCSLLTSTFPCISRMMLKETIVPKPVPFSFVE